MDAKRIISLSLSSRSESPPIGSAKDVRRRLQSNHPHTQKIYQGYGAYYVDIYVGSPPQRQTVLVDTGSENTGIPCSDCVDCGHDHTDPSFNQILSDSFQYLQCSECHMGRCDVNDNTCKVRSEYAEQSAWEGKEIQDNVYLGASDTGKFDEHNRFHAKLFCMESVGGAFREQLANGIMGLGATKGSFWRQMYDQGFIESKQFSICLDQHPISRSMVGRLTLGGVDERLGHTASTMNYMDFSDLSGYYEVKIRQVHLTHKHGHPTTGTFRGRNIMEGVTKNETITIDADERMMNQGGVIIDSGTTGTLLTPEMKGAFDEAWEIITGKPFPVEPIQISPKDLQNWPTVVLQMRGSSKTKKSLENNPPFPNFDGTTTNIFDDKFPEDVVVALPPSHYMLLDLDTQKYIPTIKFDGAHGEGSILGANFMRSHNTLFDVENKRIGMIRSDCNFVNVSKTGQKDWIDVPAPYANLNEIIRWYNKDQCERDKSRCAHVLTTKVSINLLCLLLLCIVAYWKPTRRERKQLPIEGIQSQHGLI